MKANGIAEGGNEHSCYVSMWLEFKLTSFLQRKVGIK